MKSFEIHEILIKLLNFSLLTFSLSSTLILILVLVLVLVLI